MTKAETFCCSSITFTVITLAGTEVSALLGRMPSAVGYQPTLAEEMGKLQERIASTKTGSITSVQAVYVPADDLTDPSPATTFQPLGRHDRVCPVILPLSVFIRLLTRLDSTSRQVDPQHHRRRALLRRPVVFRKPCSATRNSATLSPFWVWTNWLRKTSSRLPAPVRSSASCPSRSTLPKSLPVHPGKYVPLKETIRGFKMIVDGECDELPEQAFYMVGTIDEAFEKAKTLK